MKYDMDQLLKTALTPMDVPDERLNRQVLREIKERKMMNRKKRMPAAAIVAACTLVFGSATVFAAHRYLSPDEAAARMEDDKLQKAFSGEDAILTNETQEAGGYRITLLGSVAGKNISDFLAWDDTGTLKDDRTYTLVAVEHADGTPMPDTSSADYGKEPFFVSLYVRGLDPGKYNAMSMDGGYTSFVKDGIEYRMIEMDNTQIFADKGIYVGVNSGSFYDPEAFLYDESSGIMTRNPIYQGINALFELPMDTAKADPEAAARYLEELEQSLNAPSQPPEMDATDLAVEEFVDMLTSENIDQYAAPIEATRQICTPDKDGCITIEYDLGDDGTASGALFVEKLLSSGRAGDLLIAGCNYSETGLEDLKIDVCILNEDGTVTYVVYQPILQ